jgi:hypothetical protein
MRWEDGLLELFDDLEQQAEGLALAVRDVDVAERSRAEYARVDLASRLHASAGSRVQLGVVGIGQLDATLVRVGLDWCLAAAGQAEWVVRLAAVTHARGLSGRAVSEPARPVVARLGIGSVLRRVAENRSPVFVHRFDGGSVHGQVDRVGADFLEVIVGGPADGTAQAHAVEVVAFAHLAAVRRT